MISVRKIPHDKQRYETVGDWQFFKDNLVIKVSDTGSECSNNLIAVHEIIEALLCKNNGVSEALVDEWDMSHTDSLEPGSIPGCPYYREHMFATMIERALAAELDADWFEHEEAIERL